MRRIATLWLCVLSCPLTAVGQQSSSEPISQAIQGPPVESGAPANASVESSAIETVSETAPSWPSPWWPRRYPMDRVGFELGVVGLMRETPNDQILVVDQNFDEILNADELRGSMQFGLRAVMDVYQVSNLLGGTDLQFGYLGINSMDATRTVRATSVSPIFFNSVPVSPSNETNLNYSTNIYSGEANLRFFSARRIRPLTGFRYLGVDETYDTFLFQSGGTTGSRSRTENHLYGGQFGAQALVLRLGRFDWFANGKYGVMYNQVEGFANANNSSGTFVQKNFSESNPSSLVDAETGLSFNFLDRLDFRISYQYLFASKIATGLDQNASINLLAPGETVVFNSQSWHGIGFTALFSF